MSVFDFRRELETLLDEENGKVYDFQLVDYSEELYQSRHKIPLLYRYQPANYHNIRTFEKGQIYLAPAGKMNDIFEGFSAAAEESVRNNIGALSELAHIKSFSEANYETNSLMWGNYADNYKGFCVEYDLRDMREDYYYHFFPVVYKKQRYTCDPHLEYVMIPPLNAMNNG